MAKSDIELELQNIEMDYAGTFSITDRLLILILHLLLQRPLS